MIGRVQREVIIPFCEGEAEINLFSFLNHKFSNKKLHFAKPINIKGFSDLNVFKRKYDKLRIGQNLKPKKDFAKVRFLFIFDNDLADSVKIMSFLSDKGHLVQLCDPNTEGMLLKVVGVNLGINTKTNIYRKKCKESFIKNFGCEAHKLKDDKLNSILGTPSIIKRELPDLWKIFSNS